MLTAVIVDDELAGRETLSMMIEEFCPDIKILETASTINEAVLAINKHKPHILFLDIELANGTGFDVLDKVAVNDFKVVFTTAYDQYAIKAFKYNAVDYLLKPIDAAELIKATNKIKSQQTASNTTPEQLQNILQQLLEPSKPHKLYLNTTESIFSIEVNEIMYLKADGNYTHITVHNGENVVASKTLKDFEEMLSPDTFIRVHQSHLVNLSFVKKYMKSDGGYLVMSDGKYIEVSSRKRAEILAKLHNE